MGSGEELLAALSRLPTVNPKLLGELEARGVTLVKNKFSGLGVGEHGLAQRLNEAMSRLASPSPRDVVAKIREIVGNPSLSAPAADARASDKESPGNSSEAPPVSSSVAADAPAEGTPLTLAPDTEPAPPPATAQWQDQPPTGPWLPPALQALCGELLGDVCEESTHTICEQALSGWRVLAGTRRGRLHAHHGTYREDAFAHGGDREHERFWVFCVCDGAGSSRLSRIGSELTSRGMVRRLSEVLSAKADAWAALSADELNKELSTAIVEAARGDVAFLDQVATAAGAEPKDFRCTLLLTVLYQHGDALLACLSQVGDGFIAGLNDDGSSRRYAGATASGQFSGEVKCFVPDPGSPEQATPFGIIPNVGNRRALLLCTDGIEDPFFPVDTHLAGLLRQFTDDASADGVSLVSWPEAAGGALACADPQTARERLARWLAFEKKGENDDRTVMYIHRV